MDADSDTDTKEPLRCYGCENTVSSRKELVLCDDGEYRCMECYDFCCDLQWRDGCCDGDGVDD